MNDYNLSENSGGQIAGIVPSSIETSQYNLQGLRRFTINLRADRSGGQFIPEIEGEFLYIEKCDVLCSISLIRTDGGHEILSREGDEYSGPFRGIWITHPNMSGVTNAQPVILNILCGSGEKYTNSLANSGASRFPQGATIANTTGVNGNSRLQFWCPDGARQIDSLTFYSTFTLTAAAVSDFTGTVDFTNSAFTVINSVPVVTIGGSAFNAAISPGMTQKCTVINENPALFIYRVGFTVERLKIPSYARIIRARILVGAANNLSAASATFNTGNGDCATCYIS